MKRLSKIFGDVSRLATHVMKPFFADRLAVTRPFKIIDSDFFKTHAAEAVTRRTSFSSV